MSGKIRAGHLEVMVENVNVVRVCGDGNLAALIHQKFEEDFGSGIAVCHGKISLQPLATEITVRSGEPYHGAPLKMAVIRILENEGFKVVSMALNNEGCEKLMMYGRCENPECRKITDYHGIWRNITEYHDIFPEYNGTSRYFPMDV